MPKKFSAPVAHVHMTLDPQFCDAIDRFRRKQQVEVTRSAAVKHLARLALSHLLPAEHSASESPATVRHATS
jgi:hypothetical protein